MDRHPDECGMAATDGTSPVAAVLALLERLLADASPAADVEP